MFSRVSYLFALALALALARPLAAQQTVDVGSISGRVVDDMRDGHARRHGRRDPAADQRRRRRR